VRQPEVLVFFFFFFFCVFFFFFFLECGFFFFFGVWVWFFFFFFLLFPAVKPRLDFFSPFVFLYFAFLTSPSPPRKSARLPPLSPPSEKTAFSHLSQTTFLFPCRLFTGLLFPTFSLPPSLSPLPFLTKRHRAELMGILSLPLVDRRSWTRKIVTLMFVLFRRGQLFGQKPSFSWQSFRLDSLLPRSTGPSTSRPQALLSPSPCCRVDASFPPSMERVMFTIP